MANICADIPPNLPEDAGREPLPESLTRYTGFLIAKAHQHLWIKFSERCRHLGMEVPCCGILQLLTEHGPMSQQHLGKLLRIDRTSMVKLIDALEQAKFARRKDHPEDRRIYLVDITPPGKQVLTEVQKVADEMEKELLAEFTEEERKVIRRALQTLAG
jgi:DNA-binding MarR family transcriptional regulator